MRRRLTLAIVGTVAAALLLTGIGTLVLSRVGARDETEQDLRSEVEGLADLFATSRPFQRGAQLRRIAAQLRLEGIGLGVIGPAGRFTGFLPDGVEQPDIQLAELRRGQTVSGSHGDLVFAAATRSTARGAAVVVVTREADVVVGPAMRWFLVAAALTLLVAAVVAARLGRRLTEPLRQAEEATRQIARGDLAARAPEPADTEHDELADLVRSINAMAVALERSRGLERQFLMSVSHDLRTPLTSIRGFAEALADGTVTDPRHAGDVILTEARRLERLVRDLLDLARLDSRQFSLDLAPIAVDDVLGDAVDGFRPAADDAGISLAVETTDNGLVATADTDRLAQVVANLLENALKFARSEIRVAASRTDGAVEVVVDDDGSGIPSDDLPHVFERLYVAKRQPERREVGSGLGLAIAHELMSAMGGEVRAQASPSGGARFVVRLPSG